MKIKISSIPVQLFISVALAVLGAILIGPLPKADYAFGQIGGIFIDSLKMLVVPLAFVAITGAVIKIGMSRIRKLSFRFVVLSVFMSLVGFALGYFLMSMLSIPPFEIGNVSVKVAKAPTILEFIRNCIPVNPFSSLVKGNMLQVLTLAFFVGISSLQLKEKDSIIHGFDIAQRICVQIANLVMHIAPIGVFCLLYPVVAKSLTNVVTAYMQMIIMLVVGILIYMAFCSIPLLFLFKVNKPFSFFRIIILQDVIGAIAGGSTNYMAPRIENLKKNSALNPDVIDFFIPITAVLTRMGSTICVGIYTVFAASIFHITLSWEQVVVASLLTFIALMCAPGIIGGTLMDCAIIWSAIGIPIEAIAYIAGIDYVIDVLRTILNIQGGEIITACMNHFLKDGKSLSVFKVNEV